MQPPFIALDFPAAPDDGRRTAWFTNPIEVLEARTVDQIENVFERVDDLVRRGRHVVGFVSYEAAPAFDRALVTRPAGALPLVWFGVFHAPELVASDPLRSRPVVTWRERPSARPYGDAVEAIRQAIAKGDVYQVNHTERLDVDIVGEPADLYRRMLAAQGGGYGARIHTGRFEILSASPELFFQREGDRLWSQPMKGTARRGRWLEEDDRRAAELSSSAKERAENVMIVDLIRNDLSRVAEPATVQATRLFDVHRLPTVLQMTSTVEARVRPEVPTWDVFRALFPCGSVTGAPKIAACRVISELERDPRGVYCGAIGHISPDGVAAFSVAIRTLTIDHASGRAEYGVGSGITWDSAGSAEYDELKAKTAILTDDLPPVGLIETLRLDGGSYKRLEFHLDRLESSAKYFGFKRELRVAAEQALAEQADRPSPPQRVRLEVSADGRVDLQSRPLDAGPTQIPTVALATSPVRRNNRFLFHKTTQRSIYDRHRAEHPDAFDVLLWNEDRQVTEFTIGNVVVELGGVHVTPPRECGLLAGAMRDELLRRGAIVERVVTLEDLADATRLWLVNSVREEVEVRLGLGALKP